MKNLTVAFTDGRPASASAVPRQFVFLSDMAWKTKQKHRHKKRGRGPKSMDILLHYLLIIGFCYITAGSVYSVISNPLHICSHLQIYGNSFKNRCVNSSRYHGGKQQH